MRAILLMSMMLLALVAPPCFAQALGAVAAETVEFFGAPSVLYRYPAA